ncbi:hypothetical protein [Caballeronia concitans]|jgi:hypothetical protein|uniref:Lipoprotein n=1 Tax=Caballeronia concitans TaxID=1777133 RepID=A0A658QQ03_9BURK|nr:hypothetical protein [Caballeronia concitans]KIG05330.1 hypothetical protein BurMR1_3643 [Burkholderia sp. MR1]SAL08996.1 hypothetical protein AWB72_00044 [Caballeronia concitans]
MKSSLAMTALAVSLLAAAGVASAQQTYYRTAQVPGQATPDTWTQPGTMQQGANMQTGDASYGGVPSTRGGAGSMSMGGSPISKPCVRGPQCDIFFGN